MPHDAITIRQDVVEKSGLGQHDSVVLTKYEAQATAESGIADDPYKERDLAIAGNMMKWLQREYPGHFWATVADHRQGIVKFSIPILMGVGNWWVINLSTHDIIDGLRKGAGEILERYGLPRSRLHLPSFLEARATHSALVVPRRKVPT